MDKASRPTIGPPPFVMYGTIDGVRQGYMPALLEPMARSIVGEVPDLPVRNVVQDDTEIAR